MSPISPARHLAIDPKCLAGNQFGDVFITNVTGRQTSWGGGVSGRIMIPNAVVPLLSAAAGRMFQETMSAGNIVAVIGESCEMCLNERGGRLSRGAIVSNHITSFLLLPPSSFFFYFKLVVAAKYSGRATYE